MRHTAQVSDDGELQPLFQRLYEIWTTTNSPLGRAFVKWRQAVHISIMAKDKAAMERVVSKLKSVHFPIAHSSVSLATAHSSVSLATAHSSVSLAIAHSSVSLATAHSSGFNTSPCFQFLWQPPITSTSVTVGARFLR